MTSSAVGRQKQADKAGHALEEGLLPPRTASSTCSVSTTATRREKDVRPRLLLLATRGRAGDGVAPQPFLSEEGADE